MWVVGIFLAKLLDVFPVEEDEDKDGQDERNDNG
jgi:hypothetical protein